MFEFGFFVMNGFCSGTVAVKGRAVAGAPTNDGAVVGGPGGMGAADAAGGSAAAARAATGRRSRDRDMRRRYLLCLRNVKLTFPQQAAMLSDVTETTKKSAKGRR